MITYSSDSYLKDVNKYIYYQTRMEGKIITIKKLIDTKKFVINEEGKDILLIDNDYYILELIALDENYICRMFIDNNLNEIERLYILSNKNELIDNIPTYESLKLTYVITNDIKKIYHEDALIKAKENKIIDEERFYYLENYFNNLMINLGDLNEKIDYKKIIGEIGE